MRMVLTRPSSLNYDETAKLISTVAGRDIVHIKLEPSELAKRFTAFGLNEDYSGFLSKLDCFGWRLAGFTPEWPPELPDT